MLTRPYERAANVAEPEPKGEPLVTIDVEVRELHVVYPGGYSETFRAAPGTTVYDESQAIGFVRDREEITVNLHTALWYEWRTLTVKQIAPKFTPGATTPETAV